MPLDRIPAPPQAIVTLHADPAGITADTALAEYGFAIARAWRRGGDDARADAWQAWANRHWARSMGYDPDACERIGRPVRLVGDH